MLGFSVLHAFYLNYIISTPLNDQSYLSPYKIALKQRYR